MQNDENKEVKEKSMKEFVNIDKKDVNLKFVFDHIKNYSVCGVIYYFAFNVLAKIPPDGIIYGSIEIIGVVFLVFLSIVLMIANVSQLVMVIKYYRDIINKTNDVVFVIVALSMIFAFLVTLMYGYLELTNYLHSMFTTAKVYLCA